MLGEDYVEGKFDVEGSMRDLMRLAATILPGSPIEAARVGRLTDLIRRLMSVWRHSIDRDARQIQFHYDLSDDFYALWLDPRRVYSCAYFRTGTEDLATAQALIERHGALRDTVARAQAYGDAALDALALFPDSPVRRALAGIIAFCIARAR